MFSKVIVLIVATAAVASAFSPARSARVGVTGLRMSETPAPESTTDGESVSEEAAAPVAAPEPVVPAFNPKLEAGVTAPFGFFDPIGLCPEDAKNFRKFRESELKHGRVAMIAFLGLLFGEKLGFIFGDKITGPAIFQYQQAETLLNAWTYNVLGLALAVEGFNIIKGWQDFSESYDEVGIAGLKGADEYTNGDLSFDPLGLKPDNESDLKKMMNKELNNGRLAMLGTAGIVAGELVSGGKTF